jgi:hypothetical protein
MVHVQDEPPNESVEVKPGPKTDSGPRAWIHLPFLLAHKIYKAIRKANDDREKIQKVIDTIDPNRCVVCQKKIPTDASFCQYCGAAQPEA